MVITEYYVAIVIGMAFSLIIEETIGISLGGIIVPGYLALSADSPTTLACTYMIALATFLIIEYVMPKFVFLYGKRQFTATLIVALLLTILLNVVYPLTPFSIYNLVGIGIIVPGLLANTFKKQGIALTVITSLGSAFVVFLVVTVLGLFL